MKSKKSLIAIITLVLVAIVGVTFAYFQSNASFVNVFNTGTYRVVTTEEFVGPENWAPGQEIPKTITSTNEGTIDAAVRVSYTEKWEDSEGNDITNSIATGTAIINLDNQRDWTKNGSYYYYNYILEPGKTTSSFIKSVTLNPNIGSDITCTSSQDGLTKTCTSSNPALGAKYTLTITKETVQADKYQEVWNTNASITEKPPITFLSRQVEGEITPGDVVGIGETEDFFVISTNQEKTVLLAKYNLLVGNYFENGNLLGVYNENDTQGYGLQSIDAIGGYDNPNGKATIKFSNTRYWISNNELISPYNENDTIYYDYNDNGVFKKRADNSMTYAYIYDSNSSIYQYISGPNGYVNKLIEMGAPSTITGRILSFEEAYTKQDIQNEGRYIMYYGQDYWVGSDSGYGVNGVQSCCGFGNYEYDDESTSGIRPVIEIPTSALQ